MVEYALLTLMLSVSVFSLSSLSDGISQRFATVALNLDETYDGGGTSRDSASQQPEGGDLGCSGEEC